MELITRKEALKISTEIMEAAERERLPKPTKEEVESKIQWARIKKKYENFSIAYPWDAVEQAWTAYLALREEVGAESKRADKFRNSNAIRGEKIKELEAENQLLKEEIERINEAKSAEIQESINEYRGDMRC